MTREELLQLIADVQQLQSELDEVEVKVAHGGTPQRLYEGLSAFANQPGGGVFLFGLDERQQFQAVGVGNAQKLQEDISHWCNSEMEPALLWRIGITATSCAAATYKSGSLPTGWKCKVPADCTAT